MLMCTSTFLSVEFATFDLLLMSTVFKKGLHWHLSGALAGAGQA
jgi:hypothetical protein